MESTELYSNCDMGLAAALYTSGYKLADMDDTNPKKVKFIFNVSSDDEQLKQDIKNYWSGKLMVSAYDLAQNTKMLKSRIYSAI